MRTITEVFKSVKVIDNEKDYLLLRGITPNEFSMILGAANALAQLVGPEKEKEATLQAFVETIAGRN